MFGSKSKLKVNLDRAVGGTVTEEEKPSRAAPRGARDPAPIVRPETNQRRGPRKDLWCVCSVETKGGEVREGVIVDISKTGARVRFRNRGTLPQVVRIKGPRIGLKRFARVVWQSTFDAGLEFVPDSKIGNKVS